MIGGMSKPAGRPASEEALARAMARRTGTRSEDWFCVFKARYGMLLAFEAIRAELGAGSVSTQLLTCCTAVDPILAAGFEPCYEDISSATASIDPLRWIPSPNVRAVVLQHTYGVIDTRQSVELAAIARSSGAVLVEDSAHCLGRMACGSDGAPVADISIHSFGVEKMVGTCFGGLVWVNPAGAFAGVSGRLRTALRALPKLPKGLSCVCLAYRNEVRVLTHLPAGIRRTLWRGLPRVGLFEPAVAEVERAGGLLHEAYRPASWMCERAFDALSSLGAVEARHTEAVGAYLRLFADIDGIEIPASIISDAAQPLLRMPVLAPSTALADRIVEESRAAGCYVTAWYRPELGPGVIDSADYRVPSIGARSRLSVSDDFIARIVALPCEGGAEEATRVANVAHSVISS